MTQAPARVLVSLALGLARAGALPARAAEVGQDAIDACIDAVGSQGRAAPGGGLFLSTEFSEATSLVMLQDSGGAVWRCLVSDDGRTASVEASVAAPVHATPHPDHADGLSGGPDFRRINAHGTRNVHSAPSTSSSTVAGLHRAMIVENRGCQISEGRKWWRIADGDASGWAAGEYLVEASDPSAPHRRDRADPVRRRHQWPAAQRCPDAGKLRPPRARRRQGTDL